MSIIDIIILLFILMGGIVGFKEGVIKKLTSVIGLIVVVIIAFTFKNRLSVFFYENLPFFNLWGIFKGIQVLNIVFYEALAFVIIASLLILVYNVLLMVTGLLEKILKATVILSIPSKILGFLVGVIEYYIWAYIILFVLALPIFGIKDIHDSQVSNFILGKTPILSSYTGKTLDIYNEIYDLVETRDEKTNDQINQESMELMIKYNIITVDSATKLVDSNKVEVEDESFLEKYKQ